MALPIRHISDALSAHSASLSLAQSVVTSASHSAGHSAAHQSGRLALRGDPTGLNRHRAHCAAARNQLHGLQTAVEAVDAFLSPRFFSMLAVIGGGALLVFWLSA